MNDNFEEADFEQEEYRMLLGQGDDWPEDYDHGFDVPMQVISEILLDSEDWNLPISWPEVLFGWTGAGKLLDCLEPIHDARGAYSLFKAIDGCRWIMRVGRLARKERVLDSVFIQSEKLEQALETVEKLADALKTYWISSGTRQRSADLGATTRQRKRIDRRAHLLKKGTGESESVFRSSLSTSESHLRSFAAVRAQAGHAGYQ